jgi:hypothetical protein
VGHDFTANLSALLWTPPPTQGRAGCEGEGAEACESSETGESLRRRRAARAWIPMTCAARSSLFPAALRVRRGACLRVVCMVEHHRTRSAIRVLSKLNRARCCQRDSYPCLTLPGHNSVTDSASSKAGGREMCPSRNVEKRPRASFLVGASGLGAGSLRVPARQRIRRCSRGHATPRAGHSNDRPYVWRETLMS